MSAAGLLVAAGLGLGGGLDCRLEVASIDGRAAFASPLTARLRARPDGLYWLDPGDGRARLAEARQGGVWRSFRTAPDIDHDERVAVLDVAPDGRAVLVISHPGAAAAMVTREGTCRAAEVFTPTGARP